ncbi:MAG: hypothetical protein M3R04_06425, partial [bacterium]|nr:hypothetical protein [bacterium]
MRVVFLAALCQVLLTGCVPVSLKPIYSQHDTYFDQQLLGSWKDTAGGNWKFELLRDPGMASDSVPEAVLLKHARAYTV